MFSYCIYRDRCGIPPCQAYVVVALIVGFFLNAIMFHERPEVN